MSAPWRAGTQAERSGGRILGRREHGAWRTADAAHLGIGELARRFSRLEPLDDLCYRGVRLKARVVEVTPCDGEARGRSFRSFVLRAVAWPPLPSDCEPPQEWRSEVVIMPHSGEGDRLARLGDFEVEFAVRSFLIDVEQSIDGLLQGAGDGWGRRPRR